MKLGYTMLYVKDVPRSVAFYEDAFGLSRRFVHEAGMYAEMDTGATTLACTSPVFSSSRKRVSTKMPWMGRTELG